MRPDGVVKHVRMRFETLMPPFHSQVEKMSTETPFLAIFSKKCTDVSTVDRNASKLCFTDRDVGLFQVDTWQDCACVDVHWTAMPPF